MRDVTNLFVEYLEAKRHLWNTYFVDKVRSIRESRVLDHYETIDRLLFSALILDTLDQPPLNSEHVFGIDPIPSFRVVPKKGIETMGVMFSEPIKGSNRKWNKLTQLSISGCEFVFIEFFEWDRYGHVTYPYFMARVTKCPAFPDNVSRDCLIETKDAEIHFVAR